MAEYTKFQQKAIQNFYDNRESIALQRVQELVTELYLSTGKKLEKNWDNVILHLSKLKVDQKTLDHLRKEAKPELVATLVTKMLNKAEAKPAKK
jgi:1,2-phenylacetyl-CoA epoxidase catalytic subunit